MKIEIEYNMTTPEKEGPHPHYGRFICYPKDETANNYVARFAADIWMHTGDEEFNVSFVPGFTTPGVAFWVNGKTEGLVKIVIGEAVERIKTGFAKVSIPVSVEEIH